MWQPTPENPLRERLWSEKRRVNRGESERLPMFSGSNDGRPLVCQACGALVVDHEQAWKRHYSWHWLAVGIIPDIYLCEVARM